MPKMRASFQGFVKLLAKSLYSCRWNWRAPPPLGCSISPSATCRASTPSGWWTSTRSACRRAPRSRISSRSGQNSRARSSTISPSRPTGGDLPPERGRGLPAHRGRQAYAPLLLLSRLRLQPILRDLREPKSSSPSTPSATSMRPWRAATPSKTKKPGTQAAGQPGRPGTLPKTRR